jgi:hypothetical protein
LAEGPAKRNAHRRDWESAVERLPLIAREQGKTEIMITGLFHGTAFAALLLASAAAADDVNAVSTGGTGALTMCQSGILSPTCNLYHHVALPKRIAVGDRVPLDFGSNEKKYNFPVVRIVRHGNACTVLSQASGDADAMNKIEIASCTDAPAAH